MRPPYCALQAVQSELAGPEHHIIKQRGPIHAFEDARGVAVAYAQGSNKADLGHGREGKSSVTQIM